jgi:hypothetical protein
MQIVWVFYGLSDLCNDFSQQEEFQKFDDYAVDTLVAEIYGRGLALLRQSLSRPVWTGGVQSILSVAQARVQSPR